MLIRSDLQRGLVVVLLAVLSLLGGCGPAQEVHPTAMNEIRLSAKDGGSQLELAQGQTLVVSLESNPTTGYRWEVSGSTAPALRQVGEAAFEARSDLIGAPGVETFRFQAAAAGQTSLTLVYRRPWEEGVEPLETFSVQVAVR